MDWARLPDVGRECALQLVDLTHEASQPSVVMVLRHPRCHHLNLPLLYAAPHYQAW